jgi:hypothetical protein
VRSVCVSGHREPKRGLRGPRLLLRSLATAAILLPAGGAAVASAESNFNCETNHGVEKCNKLSGPNETLDFFEAANYTYPEFYYELYKFNGGSSYTVEYAYSVFAYSVSHCVASKSGHGGVFLQNASGNIAGKQRNHC